MERREAHRFLDFEVEDARSQGGGDMKREPHGSYRSGCLRALIRFNTFIFQVFIQTDKDFISIMRNPPTEELYEGPFLKLPCASWGRCREGLQAHLLTKSLSPRNNSSQLKA